MGDRATNFVNSWIAEHITAGPYAAEGDRHPETDNMSARLLADAMEAGISREEIEEDIGSLEDFIDVAFEEATDAEVERLASRDD